MHEEIFLGRDHFVRIGHLDCSCTVINLHYQPESPQQELRRRLRAAAAPWPTYRDGIGFLVGDFNFRDPAEGRFNSRNQTFSDGDASRAAALFAAPLKSLSHFSIVRTCDVTAPSTHFPALIVLILNHPMAELRDFQCHYTTIGTTGEKSVPSDHIPVRLVIECPRRKQLDDLGHLAMGYTTSFIHHRRRRGAP